MFFFHDILFLLLKFAYLDFIFLLFLNECISDLKNLHMFDAFPIRKIKTFQEIIIVVGSTKL